MPDTAQQLGVDGAIGVIPTDTVYGVVARAVDRTAVERLYAVKNRETKPGTLIADSIDQLVELGLKRRYLTAVEQWWPSSRLSSNPPKADQASRPLGRDALESSLPGWPGALSVVVPCGDELAYLHQGKRSLAVRIPADDRLRNLLRETGPLLTSSANQPGEPPANTIEEARNYFGDGVDFYQDGGDLSGREPSTVVRVVDDAIEVLREGAVKIDENGRIKP